MTTHHVRRGFTLIELMIVIAIIGLLAAALLPNLIAAGEQQKVAETTARLQQLKTAIEAFERKFDFYPPSDFKPVQPSAVPMDGKADAVNAGIESLMVALHAKRISGGVTFTDNTTWLGNTDGDDYGVEIPLLGTSKKLEVLDAWGNPIAYFQGDELMSSKARQRIRLGEAFGGEDVTCKPHKDPESKKPLGWLKGYQLVSAGPDGLFGADPDGRTDDITIPELPIQD